MALLTQLRAKVEDFISSYGRLESIELSNIDDAEQQSIYAKRIQAALDSAFSEIMSYDALSPIAGKYAIRLSLKQLMLDIARYRLDSLERRPEVIDTYDKVIEFLKKCTEFDRKVVPEIEESERDLLELGEKKRSKFPTFRKGTRVFTDESLAPYRNQKFM